MKSISVIWGFLFVAFLAHGEETFPVFSTTYGGDRGAPKTQALSKKKPFVEWVLEPGESGLSLPAQRLLLEVFIPPGATNVQSLVYLVDRESRWFQSVQEAPLTPGATNRVVVAMDGNAPNWRGEGHSAVWQHLTRKSPQRMGVRFFSRTPWQGGCVLLSAAIEKEDAAQRPPPAITRLRAPASVGCRKLYEVRFDLPDRYDDPFDPAVVDVTAEFTAPDGRTFAVNGFYFQNFYRIAGDVYDRVEPQGKGGWRVRFAADQPGAWQARLRVRDAAGETQSDPWRFEASATDAFHPVRVSQRDKRFFETTDGAFFYPIGHNIRSPFDARMDAQFPFVHRHPEGTTVYQRYFKRMQKAGSNLAEVWMCAWSLGLEWSPAVHGYFGAGDYNLGNAWELDEVLRWARAAGLRINLVLNNHGRVSEWCDQEWDDHPYNQSKGGWLHRANEFFSDARSIDMQKRLYRYTVARWGWDNTIFAWELMSELDLVGNQGQHDSYRNPETVEWHRIMANTIRGLDHGRHMICTHFSTDYTKLTPEYGKLKELDFHGLDTYHPSQPDQVVNLNVASVHHAAQFRKPVVINEFGGSPNAASLFDLKRELHASLWSSCATPLAGTPLFWWWHVIDENDLYHYYTGIRGFMDGIDKRDPAMRLTFPKVDMMNLENRRVQPQVEAVCMASPGQAVAWLWVRAAYQRRPPQPNPDDFNVYGVKVTLDGFSNTLYRVSHWDTEKGVELRQDRLRPRNGVLEIFPPAFDRDAAFHITPAGRE